MSIRTFELRLPLVIPVFFLLLKSNAQDQPLPKFLQDMIDAYRAKNLPNGTTEDCPTMNPNDYLYPNRMGATLPSKTTSYLDRYSTLPMDMPFLSSEIKQFTMFTNDDELVYTGPTMDPNDLLGLDLGNTDGWRHFEVGGKLSPLYCPICKKKFLKENKYYDHLLTVENMTTPHWFAPTYTLAERYKATPITCPDHMCQKECKNFGYLRLHLLEDHNGLPHNWNLTSDEYVRNVIKKNEAKERSEYIAVLLNSTRRSYVRRSNVTRPRRTRVRNVTQTTRQKRKYVRNASRLPGRRVSTLNTKVFSIIDDSVGDPNATGWRNEYPG